MARSETIFAWFDRRFFVERRYVGIVERSFSRRKRYFVAYFIHRRIAGSFLGTCPPPTSPYEDQGSLRAQVMMPTGSTLEQTQEVVNKLEDYYQKKEKDAVESTMTIAGIGFSGRSQTNGMVFAKLRDWNQRGSARLRVKAIAERATREFTAFGAHMFFALPPAARHRTRHATGLSSCSMTGWCGPREADGGTHHSWGSCRRTSGSSSEAQRHVDHSTNTASISTAKAGPAVCPSAHPQHIRRRLAVLRQQFIQQQVQARLVQEGDAP
jgi:hypothetical protein